MYRVSGLQAKLRPTYRDLQLIMRLQTCAQHAWCSPTKLYNGRQRGHWAKAKVDTVDRQTRSRMMGAVRGKDTKPELLVRASLRKLGYGYRLHRRDLPGCPDIVFAGRRKAIFVNGCFWHRHDGCSLSYSPKSNIEFWRSKFDRTVARDQENYRALANCGWKTLVLWECECGNHFLLERRLLDFLFEGEVSAT